MRISRKKFRALLEIFVSGPIRRYSLINVSTYDFKTFGPVPLGLNGTVR